MRWKDILSSVFSEHDRHRNDPHVKPINDYVIELRKQQDRFVPFVSPRYGGINARLLALHKSPGVKTRPADQGGTGFLDVDNPDQAAKRHGVFLQRSGIELSDMLSWNSIPWMDPNVEDWREWSAGSDALAKVIGMLDNLSVVMLHGNEAHKMWGVLDDRHPEVAGRFQPIHTRSLGYALVNPRYKSKAEIAKSERELTDAFESAARSLQYAPTVGIRSRVNQAEQAAKAPRSRTPERVTPRETPSTDTRRSKPEWEAEWGDCCTNR